MVALISHASYPNPSNTDSSSSSGYDDEDDDEDFSEFRSTKNGLQEVLLVCYYALGDSFFLPLQNLFNLAFNPNPNPNPSNAVNGLLSWTSLEVFLFVLSSVMTGKP
jgi:hypothetical protein